MSTPLPPRRYSDLPCRRVLGEVGDAIGEVDVALVAGCRPERQAERPLAGFRVGDAAEGTRLADEADMPGPGRIELHRGAESDAHRLHEVLYSHAVRAEQAHPRPAGEVDRSEERRVGKGCVRTGR